MSKKTKLFSGAIGGFKKSQVVEYIEQLNRKAKMTKEESDYEITRLESEVAELSGQLSDFEEIKSAYDEAKTEIDDLNSKLSAACSQLEEIHGDLAAEHERSAKLETENEIISKELSELRAKYEKLEQENSMMSDDVANQRGIILAQQSDKDSLSQKLAFAEAEVAKYKAKAEKYESDKMIAGDICERAKSESARLLSDARDKASDILAKARLDADKTIASSQAELAENMKKIRYLYKRREELLSAFRKVKDAAGGFYENVASAFSEEEE